MQKFLIVDKDESFTRDYINPDEFKLAAKGRIQIFKFEDNMVEQYDGADDEFHEVQRKF